MESRSGSVRKDQDLVDWRPEVGRMPQNSKKFQ